MNRTRIVTLLTVLVLWASAAAAQQPPLERARALYDAGQLSEARALLADLALKQPDDAGVHLLLGVIDRTTGDLPAAIASLERAHALLPASTQVSVELATTLAWHDELKRSIALYQQVLAAEPAHAGALLGLGFALAWQGELERARTIFREQVSASPANVDAWSGLGFVDRASFQRPDAIAAFQRVLELQPQNKDAATALKELHWDRRADARLLVGGSSIPGSGVTDPQVRADISYAASPRVTVGAGYQHYAYGAALPIGGVPEASLRTENSVEGSVTWRPTREFTFGNSLYTFFSEGLQRGMVWQEAVLALSSRISIVGNFRPAFSSDVPHWLFAGAAGGSLAITSRSRVTAKVLVADNTKYEPRMTLLADLSATFSRRFQAQVSVANSNSDPQFAFTSIAVSGQWLATPSLGLSVIANHRTQTFERSEVMLGVVVRR